MKIKMFLLSIFLHPQNANANLRLCQNPITIIWRTIHYSLVSESRNYNHLNSRLFLVHATLILMKVSSTCVER